MHRLGHRGLLPYIEKLMMLGLPPKLSSLFGNSNIMQYANSKSAYCSLHSCNLISVEDALYFDYCFVISRSGFEGWIWVLIASVADICILVT